VHPTIKTVTRLMIQTEARRLVEPAPTILSELEATLATLSCLLSGGDSSAAATAQALGAELSPQLLTATGFLRHTLSSFSAPKMTGQNDSDQRHAASVNNVKLMSSCSLLDSKNNHPSSQKSKRKCEMREGVLILVTVSLPRDAFSKRRGKEASHAPSLPSFAQQYYLFGLILCPCCVPLLISHRPVKNLYFFLQRDKTPLWTRSPLLQNILFIGPLPLLLC
jgi:hypothetical protein